MTRMGQKNDVEEILKHPFFSEINMQSLLKKTLKAPYLPDIPDLEKLRAQQTSLVCFKDF